MITFPVSEVTRGKPCDLLDVDASVHSLLARPVEQFACDTRRLVCCDTQHAFAKAAHDAFYDHHPLVIRPDDIWFCVVQGFAAHVGQNREALRSRLVAHEGRKKLCVDRPDFVLGRENPWPEAFEAFSGQIGAHIGALKALVDIHFSTTTAMEKAAFDVCMMDTFKGFFEYEMRVGCGIPEITLLGTPGDWRAIRRQLGLLAGYGLESWGAVLGPIVDKIAATAAGEIDTPFWRSFFRYESGSGPAELTGWIVTLFPYLVVDAECGTLGPNRFLPSWREHFDATQARDGGLRSTDALQGPHIASIPGGLASAPVRLVEDGSDARRDLLFVAGMFGVAQDAGTGALSAAFGWAVVHDIDPPSAPAQALATPREDHVDEVTGLWVRVRHEAPAAPEPDESS